VDTVHSEHRVHRYSLQILIEHLIREANMIRNHHIQRGAIAAAVAMFAFFAGAASAQDAATLYSTKCAACHGAAGKGDGPAAKMLKPPPGDFAVSMKGKADDWIAKAITGGGAAVGESPLMPAYSTLSADEVKTLVTYVKHLGGQ
jgi:mono/diheme cytochrome c family protein